MKINPNIKYKIYWSVYCVHIWKIQIDFPGSSYILSLLTIYISDEPSSDTLMKTVIWEKNFSYWCWPLFFPLSQTHNKYSHHYSPFTPFHNKVSDKTVIYCISIKKDHQGKYRTILGNIFPYYRHAVRIIPDWTLRQ